MEPNNEREDGAIENIKAKLQSAKEELRRRYGETIEKIREGLKGEAESTKDAWDELKSRF